MTTLINLTPHDVVIRVDGGMDVSIPASGDVARVAQVSTYAFNVQVGPVPVPVYSTTYGNVDGLPRDDNGVPLPCIVSGMVLDALPAGTLNVYAPDTGPTAVRDDRGRIVAVTRLRTRAQQ